VINLRKSDVSIATPSTWSQAGKGDPKKVKILREAASIFPLKDDQAYNVVSALSPAGGFTLTIDSKVVATGRAGTASPVELGVGFADPRRRNSRPATPSCLSAPIDSGRTFAATSPSRRARRSRRTRRGVAATGRSLAGGVHPNTALGDGDP